MIIEKLDGFTADGFGNVIGDASALVDGDVMRITNGASVTERRFYAPPPVAPPALDAAVQRLAMVRGRAAELDKKGKYSEANALRATIGE